MRRGPFIFFALLVALLLGGVPEANAFCRQAGQTTRDLPSSILDLQSSTLGIDSRAAKFGEFLPMLIPLERVVAVAARGAEALEGLAVAARGDRIIPGALRSVEKSNVGRSLVEAEAESLDAGKVASKQVEKMVPEGSTTVASAAPGNGLKIRINPRAGELGGINISGANAARGVKRGALQELEVAKYGETTIAGRGTVGDRLTGDHMPSYAALKQYWENIMGRPLTPAEARWVQNNGTSVALREEIHALSRTFRGRNTAAQIGKDVGNLLNATIKDTMVMRENLLKTGVSADTIDSIIVEVHFMNRKAGLY